MMFVKEWDWQEKCAKGKKDAVQISLSTKHDQNVASNSCKGGIKI